MGALLPMRYGSIYGETMNQFDVTNPLNTRYYVLVDCHLIFPLSTWFLHNNSIFRHKFHNIYQGLSGHSVNSAAGGNSGKDDEFISEFL